ncbi:MAG: preprotein translocase subunit SecA [Candidatus Omnitrophota bacterium]
MINWVLAKIIGTQNERLLKKMRPVIERINSFEPDISKLTDAQLRAKTQEFKQRLEKETIDDILPEAFAVVREAGKRFVKMRHFDVQLMGAIVLHNGKIAEMATGEGKTLVATLSAYLNALSGKGVHIVTVNDYLARRDREWMGPIYENLGLSVGAIQHDMDQAARRAAYQCDITYGTNNEFGFDYLRDNMVVRLEDMVQRPHHYAIVDEVDSILIDEARTPLIISGPAEESTDLYGRLDKIVARLSEGKRNEETKEETGDYIVDEKAQTVHMTEEGELKVAQMLNLPNLHDPEYIDYRHHAIQALRAHKLFRCDVDYMLKDGEVMIVDEFTGRLMPGRRWSDGLHQAIEAKENVKIERENQTLATITFQNYFRMYEKLSGMTGTAFTEAQEFHEIYKLNVMVIPTNRPLIRNSFGDVIYRTGKEKFDAVVDEIAELQKLGRPVLVGTVSIEKNEKLSALLKKQGVPHNVLNARYHEKEAHIVAQAGRFGAVTIATNMAGRGTDIVLGGNAEFRANDILQGMGIDPNSADPKVKEEVYLKEKRLVDEEHKKVVELGGLHVIGTERHEARRIDNQLRGRSGRQGDPGSSKFYVSLEDDLMRIFGSDRISFVMQRLGMEEGQEIQHSLVTRAIETAQKRVEAHNFDIRKHLLEYDNVMNRQREIIYTQRETVLEGKQLKEQVCEMIQEVLGGIIPLYINAKSAPADWDFDGLDEFIRSKVLVSIQDLKDKDLRFDELKEEIYTRLLAAYEAKEKAIGEPLMRELEKMVMLQIIDSKWKDHLYEMDHLREGIGLRAYGQQDPLVAYTTEGFEMFSAMMQRIKEETVEFVFKVQGVRAEKFSGVFETVPQEFVHEEVDQFKRFPQDPQKPDQSPANEKPIPIQRELPKVGRNDPCPCGSGLKYKRCHGK